MIVKISVQIGKGKTASKMWMSFGAPDSEAGWLKVMGEATDLVKMALSVRAKPEGGPDAKS